MLIDLGSSHSFLSTQVVAQLQGVSHTATVVQVQVANGSRMQSSLEMLQDEWSIQDCKFHSDLKVLDLQNFDMVIGMEWLERFSPVKVHWA
jgi:hypothetical protein